MISHDTRLSLAVEAHDAEVAGRQAAALAEADLLAEVRAGRLVELHGGYDEDWVSRIRDLADADLRARGEAP